MAHHRILGGRLLAVALFQHLILQAAGQRHDTFLILILCQELLTSLLVHLTLRLALSLHFLLLLLEIVLHNHLSLTVRHLQLLALNHVLDGLNEVLGTDALSTHLGKLLSDAQT